MKLSLLIDAALLTAFVTVAGVFGPWLDNQPSDTDAERAAAADLRDAQLAARRQQHWMRAQADLRQQRASQQIAALAAPTPVPDGTAINPRKPE